jgi:hypothetical protein
MVFFLLPTYFDHQKKTDSVNNYQLFNWKNKLKTQVIEKKLRLLGQKNEK